MSKVLIVYPHGLGDCILATPAIREYKKQTGNFIGFATLERFRSAELFKNNPYVDEVIYTKDAWNDFGSFEEGCRYLADYYANYAKNNKYDDVFFVKQSPDGSKIIDCFKALNIWPITGGDKDIPPHTEVYLTDEDHDKAKEIAKGMDNHFGFIHSKTGVPAKNLPMSYGSKWIKKNFNNQKRRANGCPKRIIEAD